MIGAAECSAARPGSLPRADWCQKVHSESASTMLSGKMFQSWTVPTGKARLPTVNSLMIGSTTRRLEPQNAALVDWED